MEEVNDKIYHLTEGHSDTVYQYLDPPPFIYATSKEANEEAAVSAQRRPCGRKSVLLIKSGGLKKASRKKPVKYFASFSKCFKSKQTRVDQSEDGLSPDRLIVQMFICDQIITSFLAPFHAAA